MVSNYQVEQWKNYRGDAISIEYHSSKDVATDVQTARKAGWSIGGFSTTLHRDPLALLFGIVGYWMWRRTTVYHILYVR